MPGSGLARPMHGRLWELQVLDALLESVRLGHSEVLVLRGEAGIGKTALLEALSERATGFRIARVVGVESEMELAFAGLHQLCAPILDRLDRLPSPQRDALAAAFGLRTGGAGDRFLVALAVLGLLSEVAQEQPLVCVIDDAQWLDRVSAQTLAFVARRLRVERIAIVFAMRDPVDDDQVMRTLPELVVRGLGDDDARALLTAATAGRLDDSVRDRIVAETRGNPLALLELPRGLTGAEMAGGFALPDASPLTGQIEESFVRRISSLPRQTQRLLLAAAAEPVGDATLLWRAAELLGVDPGAVMPAQSAGLLDVGARVRFRHPLVRSAAYRAASLSERQEIHAVLAEATDPDRDPDRRAWHRAHAAAGPDESVAAELERSAERAQARGGVAAAAALLQRAAALTPDAVRRGGRALAAAESKFDAAALDASYELLALAELNPLDGLQRARLARLRAQIVFARNRGSAAAPLLLEAARLFEGLDDELARDTYLEALATAIFASRVNPPGAVRMLAQAVRAAPAGPQPARPTDLLLDGLATRFAEGFPAGLPLVRRALEEFRDQELRGKDAVMRWLSASAIAQEAAAHDLWDGSMWKSLAMRGVQLARDTGALALLPGALVYRAGVHLHEGDFKTARALIDEADELTAATGYAAVQYASLVLAAWRGDETEAEKLIAKVVDDATARGEGRLIVLAGHASAVLYNGLGRYEAALVGAQRACAYEDVGFFGWSLVELVEAAARSGALHTANDALRQMHNRASASGTDWALGLLARSNALVSESHTAESLYQEAIGRLERSGITIHLARAHLVKGEWLRREQRRADARQPLHTAHEMFTSMGAAGFAERARRELVATGETVRKRAAGTPDVLTAQESQIARLAADGLTNQEIGAQLFLSSHTVEWHLRKVFTKLNVRSRRLLRDVLSTETQLR
jgi:DNA-binding CsgD family transcriptional regulator